MEIITLGYKNFHTDFSKKQFCKYFESSITLRIVSQIKLAHIFYISTK